MPTSAVQQGISHTSDSRQGGWGDQQIAQAAVVSRIARAQLTRGRQIAKWTGKRREKGNRRV